MGQALEYEADTAGDEGATVGGGIPGEEVVCISVSRAIRSASRQIEELAVESHGEYIWSCLTLTLSC